MKSTKKRKPAVNDELDIFHNTEASDAFQRVNHPPELATAECLTIADQSQDGFTASSIPPHRAAQPPVSGLNESSQLSNRSIAPKKQTESGLVEFLRVERATRASVGLRDGGDK
jgi:hypothetical protein